MPPLNRSQHHGSSDLVLLLGVKPSAAAWTLFMFMFISFCLFDILSILVAIVQLYFLKKFTLSVVHHNSVIYV